ncbi:hypothetical protein [Ornithinibacillus californiensis]|uniref:hypothetical protein n=1 Tax=Ornithinibacillus californiensis TaxID=161536 RepID=UPI00064DB8A3|nr:hypothetical protein [Ornithinibacillus californiensis]
MKKNLLIILLLLVIIAPFIWWGNQSDLPNGIHIEKQSGLLVLQVDDSLTAPFQIPVVWVKSHPWEKPPVIKDLLLLNQSGEEIAVINGEYLLENSFSQQINWYEREVKGEVEFILNGDKTMESFGHRITPLSDTLKESYVPEELRLTYDENTLTYTFDNLLKLTTFHENSYQLDRSWEVRSFYFCHQGDIEPKIKGLFLEANVIPNTKLEEILFWLPGMPEGYFEEHAQYTFDAKTIESVDSTSSFDGEPLTLPLEVISSDILIYLPFTDEMIETIGSSTVTLFPYFKVEDNNGEVSYRSSGGMVGQITEGESKQYLTVKKQ